MASNKIALLDTFPNGTQEFFVFIFFKCDSRIIRDREVGNKWDFFDCVKFCSHLEGGVARLITKPSHRARIAYYGLVRMVDRLAGHVLAALEGRDDTIVAYVSDHGEALGERGLWWKSTFYDESSKVPIIFAGPGIEESPVDDRVTGLLDLSATILDLAGVPALPGQVG